MRKFAKECECSETLKEKLGWVLILGGKKSNFHENTSRSGSLGLSYLNASRFWDILSIAKYTWPWPERRRRRRKKKKGSLLNQVVGDFFLCSVALDCKKMCVEIPWMIFGQKHSSSNFCMSYWPLYLKRIKRKWWTQEDPWLWQALSSEGTKKIGVTTVNVSIEAV